MYGDDGETYEFSKDFTIDNIVQFALESTNGVIESRSKVAKAMKANEEFIQK